MTVVTVKEGSLRGQKIEQVTGKKAIQFKGIPYAEPPVFDLRFKAPVPIGEWYGIRDAFEHGNICLQKDETTDALVGSECCLYLNVYTPGISGDNDKPYPVMVFIHGGAFMIGSGNSDTYGPDYLVDNDVILVTLNYRLETFGFLCLDIPEVPGYAGLKDQLLALKWVKNNIASFGGDTNNITIFGESAGSASVTFHYVSPASHGYFHKAIAQSGCCSGYWAVQTQPLEVARQICRHLGNDSTDPYDMFEFLRTIKSKKLVDISIKILSDEDTPDLIIPLTSVVEKDFNDPTQFLMELVFKLIGNNTFSKVPLLLGCTSSEGILGISETLNNLDTFINDPKNVVPTNIRRITADCNAAAIGEQILKFYFGEKKPTKEGDIVKCQSDSLFTYAMRQFAEFIAARSPVAVYFYKFKCVSELNVMKSFFKCPEAKGAADSDDIYYMFRPLSLPHLATVDLSSRSGKMILQVSKLWTNFAAQRPLLKFMRHIGQHNVITTGKVSQVTSLTLISLLKVNTKVVTVKEGSLRGKEVELVTGKKAIEFKGIPFAEPPIGDLRFKPPVPIGEWYGIRDAFEHGNVCLQKDEITGDVVGNEDCLYLNVYSPGISGEKNKPYPVMVFIHGGAFRYGSGNSEVYGPDYLVDNDVVLVTLNYRLETFGFLCLDIPEVPGNAGLKDQLLALKWIKDNIESFGGDANNITIFGESAGSVSVTFHYVSPVSHGYFHKAIAQSGCCNGGWAVQTKPLEVARQICRHLGNDSTDPNDMLAFLRTIESMKLVDIGNKVVLEEDRPGMNLSLVPVVEKNFNDPTQFLLESVFELIENNSFSKVPLLLGYTSDEGILRVAGTAENLDAFINNPKYFVLASIRRVTADDKAATVGDQIKQFYFGENQPSKEDIDNIVKYESDFMFNYTTRQFAEFIAARSPAAVYFYKFKCESELNFMKYLYKCPEVNGVSHGDDLFYMFRPIILPHLATVDLSSRSGKMILQVSKLWTNFAAQGNPTPDNTLGVTWKPYTEDKHYLEIDETLSLHQDPDRERYAFWDKLYRQAGLPTAGTMPRLS